MPYLPHRQAKLGHLIPVKLDMEFWIAKGKYFFYVIYSIHRFYLAEQSSDDPRWYLQVITHREKIVEQNLWSVEDKIYPGSLEEWAVWDDVSDTPGIMNVQVFVDNVHDSLEYTRHTAWGDGPYVRPRQLKETLYLDEFGAEVVTLRHQCMLFGRNSAKYEIEETKVPADAPVEWCLITIVTDGDGKSVEIRKGLDIETGSLTIV